MPLRKIIYEQFKNNNMRAGYIWLYSHQLALGNLLDVNERKELYKTIRNLCDEGILQAVPYGNVQNYRLTEEGEREIYFC